MILDDALGPVIAAAAAALARERRRDGLPPLKSLAELSDAVRRSQARSTVDGPSGTDDHDRVDRLAVTYRRAAERLDVSDSTLRRLIAAGELPAVRVAGAARVRTSDLENYVSGLEPVGKEAA